MPVRRIQYMYITSFKLKIFFTVIGYNLDLCYELEHRPYLLTCITDQNTNYNSWKRCLFYLEH